MTWVLWGIVFFIGFVLWGTFGKSHRVDTWDGWPDRRSDASHFRHAIKIGALVCAIEIMGMNLVLMNTHYTSVQRESYVSAIVNLRDGNETQGSGGLFYFVVETYPRFTYYVHNNDGSFSPEYVDDDANHHVRIFEDGVGNPRLDCMTDHLTKTHSYWWSLFGPVMSENDCHDYVFHVPPGTVSRQFAVGGATGGNK